MLDWSLSLKAALPGLSVMPLPVTLPLALVVTMVLAPPRCGITIFWL